MEILLGAGVLVAAGVGAVALGWLLGLRDLDSCFNGGLFAALLLMGAYWLSGTLHLGGWLGHMLLLGYVVVAIKVAVERARPLIRLNHHGRADDDCPWVDL